MQKKKKKENRTIGKEKKSESLHFPAVRDGHQSCSGQIHTENTLHKWEQIQPRGTAKAIIIKVHYRANLCINIWINVKRKDAEKHAFQAISSFSLSRSGYKYLSCPLSGVDFMNECQYELSCAKVLNPPPPPRSLVIRWHSDWMKPARMLAHTAASSQQLCNCTAVN